MTTEQAWAHRPVPRPAASVRLYCFPDAAGEHPYRDLAHALARHIDVIVVRPPASGLPTTMESLLNTRVSTLASAVALAGDGDTAFLGTGTGARLAFEVIRELVRTGGPVPGRLLVSRCAAPHLRAAPPSWSTLSDDLAAMSLLALNGTPRSVLGDRAARKRAIRSLRAELALANAYRYQPGPPLPVPITAFHRFDDPITGFEHMSPWSAHTDRSFTLTWMAGDDPAAPNPPLDLVATITIALRPA